VCAEGVEEILSRDSSDLGGEEGEPAHSGDDARALLLALKPRNVLDLRNQSPFNVLASIYISSSGEAKSLFIPLNPQYLPPDLHPCHTFPEPLLLPRVQPPSLPNASTNAGLPLYLKLPLTTVFASGMP
jgi:hypothetical protein